MEQQIKNRDIFETCILCGEITDVLVDSHIDYRVGYIEGAGQLCRKCYSKGTDRSLVAIPAYEVYNTPNNYELGEKVRKIYNDSKN